MEVKARLDDAAVAMDNVLCFEHLDELGVLGTSNEPASLERGLQNVLLGSENFQVFLLVLSKIHLIFITSMESQGSRLMKGRKWFRFRK